MDVEEGKGSGGGVRLDGRSFESESERSSEGGTGKLNGIRCDMSGLLHPANFRNRSSISSSSLSKRVWLGTGAGAGDVSTIGEAPGKLLRTCVDIVGQQSNRSGSRSLGRGGSAVESLVTDFLGAAGG